MRRGPFRNMISGQPSRTAASFLATPPVKVNWSRTPPERARIGLHGSFATTYRGHGTDRAVVAATITAAFFDDPVTRWALPDVDRRRAALEPIFRLYADAYAPLGATYLRDDGNGVAVWLPPGRQLLTAEQEVA